MSLKTSTSASDKLMTDHLTQVQGAFETARAADLAKRETTRAATTAAAVWAGYGSNQTYVARLERRTIDLDRELAFASAPEIDAAVESIQTAAQPIDTGMSRVFGLISGSPPPGLSVALRTSDGAVLTSAPADPLGKYQIETPCIDKQVLVEVHDANGQLLLQDGAPITLRDSEAVQRNFTITRCGELIVDNGPEDDVPTQIMPDLIGRTEKTAKALMDALEGAKISFETAFDPAVRGIVIAQSPDAGTPVSEGDPVVVTVSEGPEPQDTMPDLVNEPLTKARAILTDFSYGTLAIDYVDAPDQVGLVVKQTPLADATLGEATDILLCVGQDQKLMPDVVGSPETAARAKLVPGFVTNISVKYSPSEQRVGLVQNQSPQAGTVVTADTEVTLEVGQAIEVDETLRMPNFRGQTAATARETLKEMGTFAVSFKQAPDSMKEGRIFDHEPAADTVINAGDAIALHVSEGPTEQVLIPRLTGLTLTRAQAEIVPRYGSNLTVKYKVSDAAPGTILDQDPAAGTPMAAGQKIGIIVARASAARAQPKMPDLTGLTATAAKKALKEVNITKVDYDITASRRRNWNVIKQDPAKGADIKGDETVVLIFGPSG